MKRKAFTAICLSAFVCMATFANNIATSNVKLTGQNTGAHTTQVQFDVTWDNSWRTSSGPANWDAAWLFVKFRINGGPWRHASLNASGAVAPAGSTIDIGLAAPGTAFNITSNPGVGAFLYRSANGSGTFTITGAQLQWNYGANAVNDNDLVDVQVYGIEEVYVPKGAYWLGSGAGTQSGKDYGSFYKYPTETNPFQVTNEGAITVGTGTDNLYYLNNNVIILGDALGPVPAAFPKGYNAFYCMKYELSQQGYVDFLNNLSYAQSRLHFFIASTNRNLLDTAFGSSTVLTKAPYVACNFISWSDLGAYLAWAGLRPMTELEFEKACRGTLTPVPFEDAWGTASGAPRFSYVLANQNLSNEVITDRLSTHSPFGNASSSLTNSSGGPYRVGIFAASTTGLSDAGRILSGATYYGIMEMSGNVFERAVTVGRPEGRAFAGTHGNGTLTAAGFAANTDWPNPTLAIGVGQRGGAFTGSSIVGSDSLTVSERRFAAAINPNRSASFGGRGVRTAP